MTHNKKGALIYIEHTHNDEFNKAIIQNYHSIVDAFEKNDIPFIYLPKLLTDSHFNRVLEYNHPHLKEPHHNYSEKLYHVISSSLNLTIDGPTLIYLSDSGDVTYKLQIPTPELFTSTSYQVLFAERINNIIRPLSGETLDIYESRDIRFSKVKEEKFSDISFDYDLDIPSKKSL